MRLCANFINVPSNQSWNGEAEALVHGRRRLAGARGWMRNRDNEVTWGVLFFDAILVLL